MQSWKPQGDKGQTIKVGLSSDRDNVCFSFNVRCFSVKLALPGGTEVFLRELDDSKVYLFVCEMFIEC